MAIQDFTKIENRNILTEFTTITATDFSTEITPTSFNIQAVQAVFSLCPNDATHLK